jgi:predicted nucleic acid-binding protein
LVFIERHNLAGLGVGLIDVHLLASAWVSGVQIWTLDRRLKEIAGRKKVLYGPAA